MDRVGLQERGAASVVVSAEDPQVVRRVSAGLDRLSFSYRVCEPCTAQLAAGPQGAVYCLGSRVASELASLPGPTIVILYGARLTDEAVVRLQGRRVCPLRLSALTPTTLLQAIIHVRSGSDPGCMAERLQALPMLRRIPPPLVAAFLEDPVGMTRLHDLRRAVALSRESAQAMVRAAGFARAEHLFTALRSAAWMLLRRDGLNRREAEQYLGIGDRTSFRRACRRAGVPALHAHLCPDAFGAVDAGSAGPAR